MTDIYGGYIWKQGRIYQNSIVWNMAHWQNKNITYIMKFRRKLQETHPFEME